MTLQPEADVILSCQSLGLSRRHYFHAIHVAHWSYELAIVAARKLCQLESTRPSPALHSIIADAVIFAERIMQRIDAEWPTPPLA